MHSPKLLLATLTAIALALIGCSQEVPAPPDAVVVAPASHDEAMRFCADCHAWPKPETFPRSRWRAEVERGFRFYEESGRTDLTVPSVESIVSYYESVASPDLWVDLPDPENLSQGPRRFVEEAIFHPKEKFPAVSHIHCACKDAEGPCEIRVADMRSGLFSKLIVGNRDSDLEIVDLASVANPAHIEECDLDADGHTDWLVANLGSFRPEDHLKGNLLSLRANNKTDQLEVTPILQKIPRVADARPADVDGDGDLDIVAGIFGWRKTGYLAWIENTQQEDGSLAYESHTLDSRHGCSHAPVIDFDNDGDVDVLALFSQEHECVELFVNDGKGSFIKKTLYQANEPSWGSSSMHVVDLDGDSDFDIVLTNGDSFDSHLLKPYHSVQWLEQRDNFEFIPHHLANLPGAYCAKSGDLDQDGLLDIVACSMPQNYEARFNSLIWLKQQPDHTFTQYEIETSTAQHACLDLADLDRDGDLDIVVGHFEASNRQGVPWISIWWNEEPTNAPH